MCALVAMVCLTVQVAIRLLLECARHQEDTQFILLSPQDVRSIQHAEQFVREEAGSSEPLPPDFTHIISMAAPARDSVHRRVG